MSFQQIHELFGQGMLWVCLVAVVVCALAGMALLLGRISASPTFRSSRLRSGGIGLVLLAVAMLFNSYPTNADKNRANGSVPPSYPFAQEPVPRSGVDGGAAGSFSIDVVTDFDGVPVFSAWTNSLDVLCITGIAVGQSSVWMRVSWPINESLPSSSLDVFSASECNTNIWTFCDSVSVLAATNEIVIVASIAGSPISALGRHFFRVGTKVDSDGDGLSDAFERLVSQTDPLASDTDGDGLSDGWEYENGLDPNLWPDAYSDADGDGIPNLYEFHNGTQPQVPDAELVERIVAGGSGTNAVATLSAALAASSPYSVIEVADGVHEGPGWSGFSITLPNYPVLITSSDGGRSRRAIIRHAEQMAAMYLNATQTTHTVVQGLCYDLVATNGAQVAFWCGGNLPWSGPPAGGMFRDIYVRMPNPGVEYEGWFFRHYESNEVVIASCTVNAYGATSARGIYAVDSPPMSVENCTFVNFPSNEGGLGYGIQYESTAQNWGGAPDPIPLEIVNCLFDASFTNAYALAPLENGVAYDVSMINCVVPSLLEYEADFTYGLIVTNARVSFSGHIAADSPVRGAGVSSLFAPLDIDGQDRAAVPDIGADQFVPEVATLDADCDGIPDADEDWVYGSDPFFPDSDWDGSPDGAEIANGTDPLDRLSHFANVALTVTNTFPSASVTNYFGFSMSAAGWDVTNVYAATTWGASSNVVATTAGLYGKAFSDLNRNGIYDEDADVIRIVCLESQYAIVNAIISLGDIDGDGVSDARERNEGTDPYDGDNFRMDLTVHVVDRDRSHGVTNYLAWSINVSLSLTNVSEWVCVSEWMNDMSICTNVIDGKVYLVGYRDLNASGGYDYGIDIPLAQGFPRYYNKGEATFAIGDADGDGVLDSEEFDNGCDPTDSKSYFYGGHLEIEGVFATTNLLLAQVYFGTNSILGPVVQSNTTFSLDVPHLEATNAERIAVHFWDDINSDGVENNDETHTHYILQPFGSAMTSRGVLHMGQFDGDGDGMPDWWTHHWNLHGSKNDDDDGDGVINLHEWWLGSCPTNIMDYSASSALYSLANSIDRRLLGREATLQAKARFIPYTRASVLAGNASNTNCWAYGIDVSSVSPWNSWHSQFEAGTAISRRHVAFAKHFIFYSGSGARMIYFLDNNSGVHANRVIDVIKHPQVDIAIGLLEADLPCGISTAKILPEDYCKYMLDGRGLPILSFDQEEHALVHDIGELSASVVGADPVLNSRAMFSEVIISGDSGNPRFLVLGDEVVLLNLFWGGGYGSGPSFAHYKSDVQEMMDILSRRNALEPSNYHLEEADFSGFATVSGRELTTVQGGEGGN